MNKIVLVLFILVLASCNNSGNNLSREENIKWLQYRVNGRKLFQLNCSNCHGINGEGLAKLIPPVKETDWVVKNQNSIPCIIKKGMKGDVTVNNILFEGEMAAHEKLTNIEIAEISAFILKDLNQLDTFYDSNEVAKLLEECN